MSDFFASEEEKEIPSISNYMQFTEGDNRFRILGSFSEATAIQGWEYWKTIDGKRKPIRVDKNVVVPLSELEENKYGDLDIPKFFWALPVWNYKEKRVQILEIKQKTILNYIKKVIENPKWGNPQEYDFIVTRGKEGEKTVYTITNDPKEPLDQSILAQYRAMDIDMSALFRSEDPFNSDAQGEKIAEDAARAL